VDVLGRGGSGDSGDGELDAGEGQVIVGGCVGLEVAGKTVHVIGLGALGTGRAVARVLAGRGARVTVSDVKPAEALADQIAGLEGTGVTVLTGGEAYRDIERAELVVPSPGVPLDAPPLLRAREAGAHVLSEIEIAYRLARSPIIAITGTKGKTTTAALLGELLSDAGVPTLVGGNIGRPLIELAEAAQPEQWLVAEVSSFQLEATERFRPRIAVMLNLLADHLDRHGTMASYEAAKVRILANQEGDDTAVLNRDDGRVWARRRATRAQVRPYSLRRAEPDGADLSEGWLRVAGARVCPREAVRLRGKHNLGNALAALLAMHAAGAPLSKAEATLRRFPGVEHRLEVVATVDGVLFVNDSQATTPSATIAALEAFEERAVLIAGGRPKVHKWGELAAAAARHGASLLLIGEAAAEIARAAQDAGVTDIERAASLPEAVRAAFRRARPGEVVLLSPACASFDMFTNMAERGRVFRETVDALSRGERGE
jgi:UDP-N-acetylmuramoylalanine--D-glutamate ligase